MLPISVCARVEPSAFSVPGTSQTLTHTRPGRAVAPIVRVNMSNEPLPTSLTSASTGLEIHSCSLSEPPPEQLGVAGPLFLIDAPHWSTVIPSDSRHVGTVLVSFV